MNLASNQPLTHKDRKQDRNFIYNLLLNQITNFSLNDNQKSHQRMIDFTNLTEETLFLLIRNYS